MSPPVAPSVAGHAPARLVLAIVLALGVAPAWAADDAPASAASQPLHPSADAAVASGGAPPVATVPAAETGSPDDVPAALAEPAGMAEARPPGDDPGAVAAVPGPDASAEPGAAGSDPAPDGETAVDAEADFEALYPDAVPGDGADGPPGAYDPWERYNRRVHAFNNVVDARVARPLAQAYVRVVPTPVRTGVGNFFNNLGQPVSAANALLQGRPKQAAHSLGRFVVNSTLGIGGIFDPATAANLDNRSEDFGQTLGVWGWKHSRYVELPLFGPRTLRDIVGMAGDAPLAPLRAVQADKIRVPLQGLQLVDMRMQLLSTDALREGAADDYVLVRDAWSQRRAYQISGDSGEGELPDYLLDADDPTVVPVGAMPVTGR